MAGRITARIAALVVALAVAAPSAPAAAEDPIPAVSTFTFTDNMDPLGASLRPPPASGVYNSDLAFWGTKAYQGTYDGFRILDVANPEEPTSLIDYDDCFGNQGDVIVWENILVRSWNSPNTSVTATCDGEAVTLGFEGLHVFDVSNPADPDLVASVPILGCGSHTATGVPDPGNNRLLVYNNPSSSAPPQCAGFDIVQVPLDDPAASAMIGEFNPGRSCHDTAVILGEAMLGACAGGNGLAVFSVGGSRGGSLTAPVLLWSKTIEGVSIGHAASFSWDGSIVVFGHEPGGGSGARCQATSADVDKTLFFFDAVTGDEAGTWMLPRPQTAQENCTIHNFNVVPSSRHRILVSGNYQSGIAVVDFTDPAKAQEIAYADPAPLDPQTLGGDWSSYWYDGIIYEGDITRGLITWRLNDARVAGATLLGHSNPQTQEFTIPFEPPVPPAPRCGGRAATIVGTAAGELIRGTRRADVIVARGGNDRILGRGGADLVCAGPGNDTVKGQRGRDRILGGHGADLLLGGKGSDTLVGGRGVDTCRGARGTDSRRGCERGRP